MVSNQIQSKFRGSLLGSLMGDCLGAPFEGELVSSGDKIIIQRYFDKMEKPEYEGPFKKYTDDTAMMKSVAKFLVTTPEPDLNYLAKLFVNEYYNEPKRGYGQSVATVFEKLKHSKYTDIFRPASEQFDGRGSYGNGGAMRIAPISLYFHNDLENMIKLARDSTRITHGHMLGINGAILQALAIRQAFLLDPTETVKADEFCNTLLKQIHEVEKSYFEDLEDNSEDLPYCAKIKQIKYFLNQEFTDDLQEEIIENLGHGISAYDSVPIAIFCFLKAQNPIPRIETNNVFRRTIQFAITMGGDTDTIACMAGAIVGAHLGEEAINKTLLKHCEKYDDIIALAHKLYENRQLQI
ncbi:hypothetical protein ABEB36_013030 [Hypothenemus hampei]